MARTIDFTDFTLSELLAIQFDLNKAIKGAEEKARADALEAAREAAREKGFTLEALMGAAVAPAARTASTGNGGRKPRAASTKRFVNPNDADQTWNGYGRPPAWFTAALAEGHTRESLNQA
jgi:DNA-binding protein H-NS